MLTGPGGVNALDSAWHTESTQHEFGDRRGLAPGHAELSFESRTRASSASRAALSRQKPPSSLFPCLTGKCILHPRQLGSQVPEAQGRAGGGPRHSVLSCVTQIPARTSPIAPVTPQRRLIPPSPLPRRAAARARTLPGPPSQCARSHFLPLNCFLLSVFLPPAPHLWVPE